MITSLVGRVGRVEKVPGGGREGETSLSHPLHEGSHGIP